MNLFKNCLGETVGTFLLVFIGCSTVGYAVLFKSINLFEVALIWGLGIALAIYVARSLGSSHLNPAVSLVFLANKEITLLSSLLYILAQFFGALLAGFLVYLTFNSSITDFESIHQIERGSSESIKTAMIFGEFFPNPGYTIQVSLSKAMLMEGIGTFTMLLVILLIEYTNRKLSKIAPLLIGGTVSILIILIAPYTQGGFNPARDFGPRLVAYFSGWSEAAFPAVQYSFFMVYIASPILGGIGALFIYKNFARLIKKRTT